MKRLPAQIDNVFFAQISASGFGLMRIGWAITVLLTLLWQSQDVTRYFSDQGIVPSSIGNTVFRSEYRYTLLSSITSPEAVLFLWSLLFAATVFMLIGYWTRFATILSVLLLFSFQERNLQMLSGGDTVLRVLGFILMITPEIDAYSLERLECQWQSWKQHRFLLPPLRMHIWPYRLLLWQMMLIYIYSAWDKIQGEDWINGTVVEIVLHHQHFSRLSDTLADTLSILSPVLTYAVLIFELSWILLLLPSPLRNWITLGKLHRWSLKRWLILGGFAFHWGVFVVLNVGPFPFAMSAGLLGLLLDEDFATIRRILNKGHSKSIVVLYDGACKLCTRSMFVLSMLDHLHRIRPVNFRDTEKRHTHAPDLSFEALDRALHIKLPNGSYAKGFSAFRILSWHLPTLWIIMPLLYIPGMQWVGDAIYAHIARKRHACADGACIH